mgnify:CR=1 FL=1
MVIGLSIIGYAIYEKCYRLPEEHNLFCDAAKDDIPKCLDLDVNCPDNKKTLANLSIAVCNEYDHSESQTFCQETKYICAAESGLCAKINVYCNSIKWFN